MVLKVFLIVLVTSFLTSFSNRHGVFSSTIISNICVLCSVFDVHISTVIGQTFVSIWGKYCMGDSVLEFWAFNLYTYSATLYATIYILWG